MKLVQKYGYIFLAGVCFVAAGFSSVLPISKPHPVAKIAHIQIAPTKIVVPTPTAIEVQIQHARVQPISSIIPTDIPTTLPTSVPVKKQEQTITLIIQEPDGAKKISVAFQNNLTPCSLLLAAKNNGQLSSLTITHYGAPLNSDYVKEINGYSNNWTFSINGTVEPKGCSDYTLNVSDTVTWKFN